MVSVALVGADGAGKTTIARRVADRLPRATYLYMGVNLEASRLMLPSTWLVLQAKRWRGGRPDLSAPPNDREPVRRGALARLRTELRYANQIAEEWFRQMVAWYHLRRGTVVVFDRHFVWDYHSAIAAAAGSHRSGLRLMHDRLLQSVYPRPDLVICLDAPAEVLVGRKGGGTVEDRDRRRREYLQHGATIPGFVIVDVNRPSEVVIDDVVDVIHAHVTRTADR